MEPAEAAVAAVRNLTKRFPGVVANDGVSLAFRAGEIHVLLGENGAGKSTLIGMLAGMQQPDAGEILIRGRPVRIGSPRHSLPRLSQTSAESEFFTDDCLKHDRRKRNRRRRESRSQTVTCRLFLDQSDPKRVWPVSQCA